MSHETPRSEGPASDPVGHLAEELQELEGIGEKKHWGRWAIGGVLLLALIVTIAVWRQTASRIETPPLTGPGVRIEMQQPPPVKLAEVPTYFRWESIAGRQHYLFTIYDGAGVEAILVRQVKNNSVALTTEEAVKLERGKRYVWQVQAVAPDGDTLATGRSGFEL